MWQGQKALNCRDPPPLCAQKMQPSSLQHRACSHVYLHFLNHYLLDFLNHHLLTFQTTISSTFRTITRNYNSRLHLLNYFPNHHQLLLLYYLQNIIHGVSMNDQNSFISLIPAKHLLFTEETKSTSCSSQRALNLTIKSGEGCPLLKITCIYVFLCTVTFDVVIVQSWSFTWHSKTADCTIWCGVMTITFLEKPRCQNASIIMLARVCRGV